MTRDDRRSFRSALILAGTAALALSVSGCGRKGPLDLPPTASGQLPAVAAQSDPAQQAGKPATMFDSSYGSDQLPVAGKGPKRPFALDPILNSN